MERHLGARTRVQTLPGIFVVSFKQPRGRRLRNISIEADNEVHAGKLARKLLQAAGEPTEGRHGWLEYGVSKATRVLYAAIVYGNGVWEEWRAGSDHWTSPVVERRQLSREEVQLLTQKKDS
jgi:hypothetical protein